MTINFWLKYGFFRTTASRISVVVINTRIVVISSRIVAGELVAQVVVEASVLVEAQLQIVLVLQLVVARLELVLQLKTVVGQDPAVATRPTKIMRTSTRKMIADQLSVLVPFGSIQSRTQIRKRSSVLGVWFFD